MLNLPDIDAAEVARLGKCIDTHGFIELPRTVNSAVLEELKHYVQKVAGGTGQRYVVLHGQAYLAGSVLGQLAQDEPFVALLAGLYAYVAGRAAGNPKILPVLRCIQGDSGFRASNSFHFDASAVTALIPVHIPRDGATPGDLVMFPNLRPVHHNSIINFVEKAVLQNRFSRWLIIKAVERRWLNPVRVKIVPGNLYVFWGYRSLHANQPCGPDHLRATAIFHYGDPHHGSLLTRLVFRMNQRKVRRIAQKQQA